MRRRLIGVIPGQQSLIRPARISGETLRLVELPRVCAMRAFHRPYPLSFGECGGRTTAAPALATRLLELPETLRSPSTRIALTANGNRSPIASRKRTALAAVAGVPTEGKPQPRLLAELPAKRPQTQQRSTDVKTSPGSAHVMVELRGVEPLTSALRTRRSPN